MTNTNSESGLWFRSAKDRRGNNRRKCKIKWSLFEVLICDFVVVGSRNSCQKVYHWRKSISDSQRKQFAIELIITTTSIWTKCWSNLESSCNNIDSRNNYRNGIESINLDLPNTNRATIHYIVTVIFLFAYKIVN